MFSNTLYFITMVHLHLTETHQWDCLSMQMCFFVSCNKVEIAKVVRLLNKKE